MSIHLCWSTNKHFHVPRSVRASVNSITITAHQALTSIVNTSIAGVGFVITIELFLTSCTIHLSLNECIILFSYIYIYIFDCKCFILLIRVNWNHLMRFSFESRPYFRLFCLKEMLYKCNYHLFSTLIHEVAYRKGLEWVLASSNPF